MGDVYEHQNDHFLDELFDLICGFCVDFVLFNEFEHVGLGETVFIYMIFNDKVDLGVFLFCMIVLIWGICVKQSSAESHCFWGDC